jgi:50S ribosomal subunit-associated GTPase HflX
VTLSAHDALAVAELEQRLIAQVRSQEEETTLFIPYRLSNQLSLIYANCRVLGTEAGDAGLKLQVQASPAVMARLRSSLKGNH